MWVASEIGPQLTRIDPATTRSRTRSSCRDQGAINANQLLALADGDLWLPLFDPAEVVRVAVPA